MTLHIEVLDSLHCRRKIGHLVSPPPLEEGHTAERCKKGGKRRQEKGKRFTFFGLAAYVLAGSSTLRHQVYADREGANKRNLCNQRHAL